MRNKFALLSIFLFLTIGAGPRLWARGIGQSNGQIISRDAANDPHAETFCAVNPKDPHNLLVASMVVEQSKQRCVLYVSHDDGNTWNRVRLGTESGGFLEGGDPIVYFDADGTGYFGTVSDSGFSIIRSTDGGGTWSQPTQIGAGCCDRPYLAFDNTGGKFNGRIYAGGSVQVPNADGKPQTAIAIYYSTDGGKTFSSPKLISHDDDNALIKGIADLIVTPSGALVVPLTTHRPVSPSDKFIFAQMSAVVSDDGGATFSKRFDIGPRNTARGFRLWKSDAAPRAAIDMSSTRTRGRIYLTWMDATNERFDVKIAHSDDGRKWSSPVRVNDNGQPADNANPAIAVNQDGILCVAWNDRRNDPKNICFQLYFAASTDGGETFLPNVRLQETSTCPNAPGNWKLIPSVFPMRDAEKKLHQVLSMYGFPIRFPNGGDTQGLVTGPGGAFRLAGINGESGVMQLSWTRIETTRELPATTGRSQPADESLEMDLVVSSPLLDGATRVMSVDVTLVNNLRVPVAGPLTLVLEKMGSSLKGVQVTNSDNHKTEAGAAWEFKITGEGQILAPGGRTESRTLRWSFSELPAELDDYPADMTFKVVRGTAITR